MKILFFDTETSGFEKYPRVIQLAFMLTDEIGNPLNTYCELIYPDGWEIPKDQFFIDNGFDTEINKEKGIPIKDALNSFIDSVNEAELLVAHNLSFDKRMIGQEMLRLDLAAEKKEGYCTMFGSIDICKIPDKSGKNKRPSLEELYDFLFSEKIENAHDALGDVKSTVRCFFELHKRNLLPLEIMQLLPVN